MKEIPAIPFQVSVEELWASPHYQNILAKVKALEPLVPAFDFEGPSNMEKIKARLAMRAHHELIMSILSPKGKSNER